MPGGGGGGSIPLYPFENPAHAVVLVAFGGVYWMIATAIRLAAKNKETMIEIGRHNPLYYVIHRRSMTVDEVNSRVPSGFWVVYGWFGVGGQWIGGLVSGVGVIGLLVSVARKFL